MQDLFNLLLLSNSALTILFIFTVAIVVGFNYERDVLNKKPSEVIFNSEDKADITLVKIGMAACSVLVIVVTLVVGVREVIHYESGFATNWWLAGLDILLIGFFGWMGYWSSWKVDFRYWIISTFSVMMQLAFTIDFLAFLFS